MIQVLNATRLILASLMILFSSLSVHAQQINSDDLRKHTPKRVISRIEFLIGANLIYTSGAEFLRENRVGKFGFHSTLGLVHTFSAGFDLDLKVSYETKGYKFKYHSENPGPPPTDEFMEDLTLNYATATLLPRYSVLPQKKFEVGLGPYVGYLINTKATQKSYHQNVLVNKYQARVDPDLNFKEFDFGISIMVGSNFVLKERAGLTIQFLYSRGLVDFNKPLIASKINNTFSLLVGITIERNKYLKL